MQARPPASLPRYFAQSGFLTAPALALGIAVIAVGYAAPKETCEGACPSRAEEDATAAADLEITESQKRAELLLPTAAEPAPCDDPAACPDVGACQIAALTRVDGAPADGVRLLLDRVDAHGSLDTWEAVSHDGGLHRFVDLPRGTYHLTAWRDAAHAPASPPSFACDGDNARAYFALDLAEQGTTLHGRVTGRGGTVAKGTTVLLAQPGGERDALLGVAHVPVDAAGRFTVRLREGRYRLLARAPHHGDKYQDLTIGSATVARTHLRLDWRPEANGVVTDANGQPQPGAEVFLGPVVDPKAGFSSVTADDDGRFSLPIVPGRPVVLAARVGDELGVVRLGPATRLAGHHDVTIRTRAARTVSGFVTKRNGLPHPFGEVQFRVKGLGLLGSVQADGEGRFAVSGMPLGEDVELWAKGSAIGAWGRQVATLDKPKVLLTYVPEAY